MTELLAWDGPWTRELIVSMESTAIEIETKREQAQYRAALAAIASVFSKGDVGKKYSDSLERILEAVKSSQRKSDAKAPDRHSVAAQKLVDSLKNMKGIKKL